MTKRNGDFNENVPKKFKVEDNIDALWGEDLDAEDVDDCLLLATQICEQNQVGPVHRNNVSVLPNYSFFKQNGDNVFTSTQCISNVSNNRATTSKFTFSANNIPKVPNMQELQKKVEKLEGDYMAKEGEISILRSQLKQVRISLEADHQKKEKEWNEKFDSTSKELISTKSELDFKNLEVANLRNKIAEVAKNHANINLNSTKLKQEKRSVDVALKLMETAKERIKYAKCARKQRMNHMLVLMISLLQFFFKKFFLPQFDPKKYPLQDKIDPSIFTLSTQEHFHINSKRSKFNVENDRKIIERYKANAEYNNFKLDSIFPYIFTLTNLSRDDLNGEAAKEAVDKILLASLEITQSLHKNLSNLEYDIQEETIRQRDLLYLDKKPNAFHMTSSIFGTEEWFKNEIGIKSRRITAVLAEILPYTAYLRQKLLEKSIYANTTLDNFFHLVHSAIKIIGVLRISERCVGFLSAVVIFMTRISETSDFCNWYVCIGDIIKEIIFTRPPKKTLEYISEFLKQSSLFVDFIRNMCRMTQNRSNLTSSTEQVLYYDEESCLLTVFSVLYNENLLDSQNCKIPMAMLQFIKQVLSSNVLWTYYNINDSNSNSCNCLRKIVKIGIKIIHETTKCCIDEKNKCLPNKELIQNYESILKFSIDLLHMIKFQRMDIFNKYSVISQYKFIVKTLLEWMHELNLTDQERETLKDLNLRKEAQTANDSILSKIPIWD